MYQRGENFGYRLQKRIDFQVPIPDMNNNFYKNHSFIDPKHIRRLFKGPLYSDAGKLCIDLTRKYELLENFKFQTQMDDMSHQLCFV